MGREPRFVPPNSLQHVTDITFQNRRFLRPSKEVNERILGVLGRAQKKYEMEIHGLAVASTHWHFLLRPRDAAHLSSFMCFVKTNVSKEIGKKLLNWDGAFFNGRYHSTTVSNEAEDQVGVLRYILAHGPKELLVDSVAEWPGAHSAVATIKGEDLVGKWFDRTSVCNSRARLGESVDVETFATEERVVISPLPCWQHMPEEQWRSAVADLVEEIDLEAAAVRRDQKKPSLGVKEILNVDPKSRADHVEKSPKPRFHARNPAVYRAMLEIWREVIRSFREASDQLRSGIRNVAFPEGTFPPGLPFVPFSLESVWEPSGSPSC